MNHWLLSIVHVISTFAAAEILYVLPDNVSDANCPSQPCGTLDQYLLNNGSLPVLSNVEYYFLPGEHHVCNVVNMVGVFNFSLIGFGLLPVKLICWSQSYVSVFYSYNVTISNLIFSQCNGDLVSPVSHMQNIAAGLFLYECSSCKVEDIYFFGYGFAGINLFLNSYVNNITIDLTIETPSLHMCSPKLLLMFTGTEYHFNNESIVVNNLVVSGYSEKCYEYHEAVDIQLHNSNYSINVELCNSLFYDMDRIAINIQMEHVSGSLSIKNCAFENIKHKVRLLDQIINVRISTHHVTLKFEYCEFYSNVALTLIVMEIVYFDTLCTHPSNITVENCDFYNLNHDHGLFKLSNDASGCKANVFLNEMVNFISNTANNMLKFSYMVVKMGGAITLLDNIAVESIINFEYCDVIFSNTIKFISNMCQIAIYLMSSEFPYIIVMEHANIIFTNQTYAYGLIYASAPAANDYDNIFPYCMFQYTASNNNKLNISESLARYAITFVGNRPHSSSLYINNFLIHCKWLPTAVFNGYNPGYINQQIIQVDGRPWVHYKEICCCPYNEGYNCTVDLLGPIYPGQKLKVELCIPQAESETNYTLFVETYSTSLPNKACKIAEQTELISTIGNHPKTFNFTIISDVRLCELFLTVQPLVRTAFYVQLSPCPIGFTLQNGKCDCDPFLPPDIDTCYIDLSAITRPANTWITAHTLTNNTTNYLISDCPMDYCLPYSTNVNLLYPDLQCQFNRTGILCSQCQHPLSMVFASSRCMKCTNVHILITIIVIVAGIVLVVFLYVLNLTVTKGTINGMIFYANMVSINDSVFLVNDNVFKPLRVFISFINLDLGIETCFYDGMDSYAKMWLQLFFPSYLIIIAVSIIIASRYSSRILRLTYSRSLPVLATLFLLSYTGVLRVVLTVLFSYSTITEYPSGDKEIVWSIDASVPLFGLRFTILFITCLALFLILIPFNITLLFTRFLSQYRIINRFKPLLDAFQGSYKDQYYYWVALNIIFRSIFFSLYPLQGKLRVFLACIILVAFMACYGYISPSKSKTVNIQNLSLLVNLTIMHMAPLLNMEQIFSIVTNFLISVTFMQFCIIVLYHFLTYTFHYNVVIKEKFRNIFAKKIELNQSSYNVALLNVPECT